MSNRSVKKLISKRSDKQLLDDPYDETSLNVGRMKNMMDSMALLSSFKEIKLADHKFARRLAETKAADATEALSALELDARFATACVNTQYQILQRLFVLRVNENQSTIARLTRELEALRTESNAAIQLLDRQLAERDARIEQLETHMKSMYIQLTVLDDSQHSADEFHRIAKEELLECGIDMHVI